MYLTISILLKLSFNFIGFKVKRFASIAFLVDLYLTYMIVLGTYYLIGNTSINNDYTFSSNLLSLIVYLNLAVTIGFFLSSVYIDKNIHYNPFLGISLMILFEIFAVLLH